MTAHDPTRPPLALRRFADVTCQTCGDASVLARVVRIRGSEADVVDAGGCMVAAACELSEPLRVGDVVVVDAGVVLQHASAAEQAAFAAAEVDR